MKPAAALGTEGNYLKGIDRTARAAEYLGFAGLWSNETKHDGFLPLAIAANETREMELGTSVAIAFSRSPMETAQTAWDLQDLSEGRFLLGLGTQVRAHVTRRFSMPWDRPASRLRDYILALRAIWGSFQTEGSLQFEGEFYRHTLMTPFFNPGPIEHPEIPIYIAGVNTRLAKLAGELCDGFHVHPFYTSTPSYRVVLEAHGWEDTGQELGKLARDKKWDEMPGLITDEMLRAFAVEAAPDEVGPALKERYQGLMDRVALYVPFVPGERDEFWQAAIDAVNAA